MPQAIPMILYAAGTVVGGAVGVAFTAAAIVSPVTFEMRAVRK